MGRGILLIVLASTITLSKMNASEKETEIETHVVLTDYQEKVLARELAHSALNVAVSKATRDFASYRAEVSDRAYGDGMYAWTASGDPSGPVTLEGFGQVGGVIHRIVAVLEKSGDPLLDAITLDGPFSSVTSSGTSFTISGIDAPLDDEDEESHIGSDGHAIRTTLSSAQDMFLGAIAADQLQGVEGSGDVVTGEPNIDLDALQDSVLAHPSLTTLQGDQKFKGNDSFGSRDNPVVMSVNGDVKVVGSVEGFGILLINGSLTTPGTLNWEGIIMVVSDGGSTDMRGNVEVRGALIMRSLTAEGETGGHDDAGLEGGHFDVGVLRAGNEKVYHEHQYDDRYDTTTLDLLSEGCDEDGGLCWETNVTGAGLSSVRIETIGHGTIGGDLYVETSATVVEGGISDGLDLTLDPSELNGFELRFTAICDINGSTPADVEADVATRDGQLSVRVMDPANSDSLLHEVVVYRHSSSSSCTGNRDNGIVDVAPQRFYVNGNVNIQRSTSALSNVSGLMPFLEPEPAEISMTSMRHHSNEGAL